MHGGGARFHTCRDYCTLVPCTSGFKHYCWHSMAPQTGPGFPFTLASHGLMEKNQWKESVTSTADQANLTIQGMGSSFTVFIFIFQNKISSWELEQS